MLTNTGELPELTTWSDEDFADWWKYKASNPLSFFTGRCPHCGSNHVRVIVKSRDMVDGYDTKRYDVVESAQVECRRCMARGGLYQRELLHTPERPKMMASSNWSVIQSAIGFWNNRY